ncbi:MAG: leucine-rich repeat protein [Ruminococcus sp.]|nr:leucine-rich repeat protein [Ruminococcus sp.]
MKKIFSALFGAAVLAFVPCSVASNAAEQTFSFEYEIKDKQVTVTGCNENINIISIPSEIEGFPVVSVADNAFSGNTDIISCILPDSITSVGEKAFSNCPLLSSLSIGKGLSDIGDYAFTACPELKNIIVSLDNPTYKINEKSLYDNENKLVLFADSGLNSFIASDTVSIGKGAFFGRTDIISIVIPNTVTSIGDYAFSGCVSLREIVIPDNVEFLGKGCFISCNSLENVELGKSLTTIPEDCFHSCSKLKTISINDNITSVGDDAFYSCTALKSLYIPPSVTSIGKDALGRKYNVRSSATENIADFLIRGKSGSQAEKYASEYSLSFSEFLLVKGDINNDGYIDAIDASKVLKEYARISSGQLSSFTPEQKTAADWNGDGLIDAVDSSGILIKYATLSSTQTA